MFVKPNEFSPIFSYGPIVSHNFIGGISKDRNKYRFRFELTFENGITIQKQQGGFRTLKEANENKEKLIHEILSGTYCVFNPTLKELFDYWLFYVAIKELNVAVNTQQAYCNIAYRHILPFLGENTKLSSVTPESLLKLVTSRESDCMKKRTMNVLKLVFQYAYQNRYIKTLPAKMANEIFKKTHPSNYVKRDVTWSLDTIKMVLIRCKEDFPELYLPVLLSLMLGTRISETIVLKYQDIDFMSKTVYVSKQLGYQWDSDTLLPQKGEIKTKTENGNRFVPLPDWVAEEIIVKRTWYEEMKKKVPEFQDFDYICCRHDGTPYCRTYWGKQFKILMNMCGLSAHWHDMRHVYATMLKNNQLNMKAISSFLGHAKPEFTENIYISPKEIAYDCTILEKYWNRLQKPEIVEEIFVIPIVPFAQKIFS